MSGQTSAPASQETLKVFKRVKLRGKKKLDWAIFKIDQKIQEIVPEKTSADEKSKKGIDGLVANLPDLQPRYAVYDHEFKTTDGRATSKLWFISFTPINSNQIDRMVYAHAHKPFREGLKGVHPSSWTDKNELLMEFGGQAEEEEEEEEEDFD
ncbi:hypothetical protein AAMO2058_001580600 [Amorphochlora amoebiformis]|mmetsp:Transcript_32955/g.53018  ORF Transcript_32955/g.53018 Transcript_32955/m.53018 type:complete len:153 (-) Transcript_32955:255-713(-)